MHLRCVCNQTFTFGDVALPHRVSCFVCGRKWMVLEDGTIDQIQAKTVCVSCGCGQAFTVHSIEFPRKLRCLTCKRGFSVFDTGEIIDTNEELPQATSSATAIEDKSANEVRKAYGSTAIRTQIPRFEPAPKKAKPRPAPVVATPTSLHAELALVDLRWRIERMSYALFDAFGIVLFASRRVSAIVGIVCLLLSCAGWLLAWKSNDALRPCLCVFMGIVQGMTFAPILVMVRYARKYDDAQTEWLRQRRAVIARHARATV